MNNECYNGIMREWNEENNTEIDVIEVIEIVWSGSTGPMFIYSTKDNQMIILMIYKIDAVVK
jgi:hypothetical protein